MITQFKHNHNNISEQAKKVQSGLINGVNIVIEKTIAFGFIAEEAKPWLKEVKASLDVALAWATGCSIFTDWGTFKRPLNK